MRGGQKVSPLWGHVSKSKSSPFLVELPVGLGLRAEAGPDGDHEVGVLLVYLVDHLLTVGILLGEEVHGVPQIVGTPVLPVLDDAVEGHLQLAVLVDHAQQFGGTLVALLALPVAVGPEREHRHVAREMAHLCNHPVGRAAVHEVVVDAVAHLRRERHALHGIVVELGGRVVVPVESPALDALQHVLEVLQVRLLHQLVLAAAVHLAVLHGAQSVDGLVLVEREGLGHLIGPFVGPRREGFEAGGPLLPEQCLAVGLEGDGSRLLVDADGEPVAAQRAAPSADGYGAGLGYDRQTLL